MSRKKQQDNAHNLLPEGSIVNDSDELGQVQELLSEREAELEAKSLELSEREAMLAAKEAEIVELKEALEAREALCAEFEAARKISEETGSGAKIRAISVRSANGKGFCRAGRRFDSEPTFIPILQLSEADLRAIRNEKMLRVKDVLVDA